jgi:hypothetical protein
MKTMNMPGFTAEASIYKANKKYRLVATLKKSLRRLPVMAQMQMADPVDGGEGGDTICDVAWYCSMFGCAMILYNCEPLGAGTPF